MVRNVWRRGLVLAAAQLALTAGPAMSQSVPQQAGSFSNDCALNPKCVAEPVGPAMSQSAPQQADSFSNEELVCALNPNCGADRVIIRRRGITISQPESRRTAPPPYFNNITFDFDSAELTNAAQAMLDRIAFALHDPSIGTLAYQIEGHTDAKGSVAYNQILSERRAGAVRNYLITMGVSKQRLIAVGFGKTRPLPNPPAASPYAPINRRVQFSWINAGH